MKDFVVSRSRFVQLTNDSDSIKTEVWKKTKLPRYGVDNASYVLSKTCYFHQFDTVDSQCYYSSEYSSQYAYSRLFDGRHTQILLASRTTVSVSCPTAVQSSIKKYLQVLSQCLLAKINGNQWNSILRSTLFEGHGLSHKIPRLKRSVLTHTIN